MRYWLMLLCLMLLSACGAAIEPIVPTPRPSVTPPPTNTPEPTSPFSPTPPPSPTPPLPPGVTATSLLGFAPTPEFAAVTPTNQSLVPGALRIEYFTTDISTAAAGDVITLFWAVQGADAATVYRLEGTSEEPTRAQSWRVPRAGSLQVAVRPADDGFARFELVVSDSRDTKSQTVTIATPGAGGDTSNCPQPWFLTPPNGLGCPDSSEMNAIAVQQPFERGFMLWFSERREVYVFFEDRQTPSWALYPDQYNDSLPPTDPNIAPPVGKEQPVRGFGLVWRERDNVRQRLGWATAAEASFDGSRQLGTGGTLLKLIDGRGVAAYGNGERWVRTQ